MNKRRHMRWSPRGAHRVLQVRAAVLDAVWPPGNPTCGVAPQVSDTPIELSVGSVGDAYDNALAETINGLFKAEVIHRRGPWRSFEAVEFATLEWVGWFNNRRLLEPVGNIPPAEAENAYYAAFASTPISA